MIIPAIVASLKSRFRLIPNRGKVFRRSSVLRTAELMLLVCVSQLLADVVPQLGHYLAMPPFWRTVVFSVLCSAVWCFRFLAQRGMSDEG